MLRHLRQELHSVWRDVKTTDMNWSQCKGRLAVIYAAIAKLKEAQGTTPLDISMRKLGIKLKKKCEKIIVEFRARWVGADE